MMLLSLGSICLIISLWGCIMFYNKIETQRISGNKLTDKQQKAFDTSIVRLGGIGIVFLTLSIVLFTNKVQEGSMARKLFCDLCDEHIIAGINDEGRTDAYVRYGFNDYDINELSSGEERESNVAHGLRDLCTKCDTGMNQAIVSALREYIKNNKKTKEY